MLVPNLQGLHAALEARVTEIAVFAAASETFSQKNTNASIEQSLARLHAVVETALARGLKVRGYVSCALGCPFEGAIEPAAVAHVASALHEMGSYEISLGDTIGVGTPLKARAMITAVAQHVPISQLAVHYHDTWGQALANILASLELGISVVDIFGGRLGRLPLCPGRDRQCRDGRRGLHAKRHGDSDRRGLEETGCGGPSYFAAPRPAACFKSGRCYYRVWRVES